MVEWQTRRVANLVAEKLWGFESPWISPRRGSNIAAGYFFAERPRSGIPTCFWHPRLLCSRSAEGMGISCTGPFGFFISFCIGGPLWMGATRVLPQDSLVREELAGMGLVQMVAMSLDHWLPNLLPIVVSGIYSSACKTD